MEIDGAIDAVEKYLREFLLYLISFFWRKDAQDDDPQYDTLNKSMIFAVLSATVGSYLWTRYFGGDSSDLIGVLTDNLMRWVSLGLILYLILRLFSIEVHILLPVIAVVKVFAVAHVVSVYAGYIAKQGFWYVASPDTNIVYGPLVGIGLAYLIDAVIVVTYLPGEIASFVAETARTRRGAATVIALVIMLLVIGVRFNGWLSQFQDYRAALKAGHTAAPPNPATTTAVLSPSASVAAKQTGAR